MSHKMTPEEHLDALLAGLEHLERLHRKFDDVPIEAFSAEVSAFLNARLSMISEELEEHQGALGDFLTGTGDQVK